MTLTIISDKPQTLKDIRLNHHISINDLAYEAEVSRHAIIRMEQLCYPSPLPSIITALSDITGLSEFDLEDAYLTDVRLNRLYAAANIFAHRGLVYDSWEAVNPNSLSKHPFQQFREVLFRALKLPISRIYFSGAISAHPATLDKYEQFKSGLPEPLRVALQQSDCSDAVIQQLAAARYEGD